MKRKEPQPDATQLIQTQSRTIKEIQQHNEPMLSFGIPTIPKFVTMKRTNPFLHLLKLDALL
jgi:hypothetical protein